MFLKNPLFHWLKWEFVRLRLRSKYHGLVLGNNVKVSNSTLGQFNLLCDDSVLGNVTMGDFSYAGAGTKIGRAQIGKFCSIGPNVKIGLGIHPTDFVSTHPIFYSTSFPTKNRFAKTSHFEEHKEIFIGHDVWIGANATVFDGVTIGNGAIVAAGAVVNRDVEPYTIVGGLPARTIKSRFSQSDINFLEDSCWWDLNVQWLKNNFQHFHDIDAFRKLLTGIN